MGIRFFQTADIFSTQVEAAGLQFLPLFGNKPGQDDTSS
jgi:hypothetical protein